MSDTRMSNNGQHDFLAELACMADFLEAAFADLTPQARAEDGAGGSFSPIEHIWHLADLEQQGFSERIRRLLAEDEPELEDFAGARIAREGRYKERSWAQGIAAFRSARNANLERLRGLDAAQWQRRGTQQGVGPMALCDLPGLMAEHDASHRDEIDQWLRWHGERIDAD